MPQHKGEDNIPPRNTVPFARRAFPPDLPAGAIGNDFRKSQHAALEAPFRAAHRPYCLMGWTGGTDTLSQVELDFPSAEAAVAYAKRQGLNFIVQRPAEATQDRCPTADKSKPCDPDRTAAPADDSDHAPESSNGWSERSRPGRRKTELISTARGPTPLPRSTNPNGSSASPNYRMSRNAKPCAAGRSKRTALRGRQRNRRLDRPG
jgi:hypothetical protein